MKGETVSYKWIADRIESLDPETDYEEIWRLSSTYYVNEFMMNILYTVGFPHFTLPPHGVEVIARAGGGKLVSSASMQKRERDTADAFWRWFDGGPSSLDTQTSVGETNRKHAGIARKYPGAFTHQDDFIYTMCWIGCDIHRLRLRVGMPGFTDVQKRAIPIFWRKMAEHFVGEDGHLTEPFPRDFDAMLAYLDAYEGTQWEHHPEAPVMLEALLRQFSDRWFPPGLRWAGRRMILALWDEPVRRTHRIPRPSRLEERIFELGVYAYMFTQERILPDPKRSTPQRLRQRGRLPQPVAAQPVPTGTAS
jgi:hypothetical protein